MTELLEMSNFFMETVIVWYISTLETQGDFMREYLQYRGISSDLVLDILHNVMSAKKLAQNCWEAEILGRKMLEWTL